MFNSMNSIKSKFNKEAISWGIFMIFPTVAFAYFVFDLIKNYEFNLGKTALLIFFIFLFIMGIVFLKHIKKIVIKGNELKCYSVLRPFGKTLNLNDYLGKVYLTETGRGGSYRVIYLIDKNNKTSFKIMELHYKNFEEIDQAIDIKKIRFSPSGLKYLKLLFFERAKIS